MLDETPCPTCTLPAWKHSDPQSEWGHCGARPYPCPVADLGCCEHSPSRHPDFYCLDCKADHKAGFDKTCGVFLCQKHKGSYTYGGD